MKKELRSHIFDIISTILIIVMVSILGFRYSESLNTDLIYIVGSSMQPTLSGSDDKSEFGYLDISKGAINNIKRFDIVSLLYSFDAKDYEQPYVRYSEPLETSDLKIKRVIGLPGDTLSIDNYSFTISYINKDGETEFKYYDPTNLPFSRLGDDGFNNPDGDYRITNRKTPEPITLGDDEYFVCGDNWMPSKSYDCLSTTGGKGPCCVYKENIYGVLIKIMGYCEICNVYTCKNCGHEKTVRADKIYITCENCGCFNFIKSDDFGTNKTLYDKPKYFL